MVLADERVENVLLPVRDGLMIMRKTLALLESIRLCSPGLLMRSINIKGRIILIGMHQNYGCDVHWRINETRS